LPHDLIGQILFWSLATLLVVDLYFVLFHRGIPNIRTAPAIRKKMIELLKEDFARKGGKGAGGRAYTIADCGSGNGLLTREIAKALPAAKVIGIEVTPQSLWWANMQKGIAKLGNLEYRKMNFFAFDFAEADAVTAYLIPTVLGDLGKKLQEELPTGGLALSNKFRLGGWGGPETLRIKTLYPHQGNLHIYRK